MLLTGLPRGGCGAGSLGITLHPGGERPKPDGTQAPCGDLYAVPAGQSSAQTWAKALGMAGAAVRLWSWAVRLVSS